MNTGYSIDLRERVVAYIEQGGSKIAATEIFQVSRRTIYYWLARKRKMGNLSPNEVKEYKVRKLDKEKLQEYIDTKPDATLEETGEAFGVSPVAIWKAFKRMKITRKKNTAVQRAKRRRAASVSDGNRDYSFRENRVS